MSAPLLREIRLDQGTVGGFDITNRFGVRFGTPPRYLIRVGQPYCEEWDLGTDSETDSETDLEADVVDIIFPVCGRLNRMPDPYIRCSMQCSVISETKPRVVLCYHRKFMVMMNIQQKMARWIGLFRDVLEIHLLLALYNVDQEKRRPESAKVVRNNRPLFRTAVKKIKRDIKANDVDEIHMEIGFSDTWNLLPGRLATETRAQFDRVNKLLKARMTAGEESMTLEEVRNEIEMAKGEIGKGLAIMEPFPRKWEDIKLLDTRVACEHGCPECRF